MSDPLPRALEILWHEPSPSTRSRGLSRERIVEAAVALADADGLAALSMARLAERLGCGTMSLYRHVANKDELVTFMLSTAPGPPPIVDAADWRGALTDWASGLWDVYHRHPWVLSAAAAGPPADPGQLAWLNAGLAALGPTGLSERDKLAAVMAMLHYVRGAAALHVEAAHVEGPHYPDLLRRVVDVQRFPALAAAVEAGVFDAADEDHLADFHSGLRQLLDGVAARIGADG
ncbi:TetR/AcrR family transcriptional regulator [Mycolicibacterium gadium]|uniref:TetR/AcrR family transcriptional regulator n=1 Tax=Mycolicibacterium gadium TaxID=1794 RepID=A0ABT6GJC6_MYCGU|nr:TetR/AcrR family transcriptional regulator [Mycolicibacterium gadium]MDG5481473.1 TetR/AcrR family transcriptional regulator [Mycolicibacterium gadium]